MSQRKAGRPPIMEDRTRVQVYLPGPLLARLDAVVAESGASRGAVVRRLLEAALDGRGESPRGIG